jgi:hypothetical protein
MRPAALMTPAERRRADDLAALVDGRPAVTVPKELRDVVALLGALPAPRTAPDVAFRDRLRDQLVAECGQRAPAAPANRPKQTSHDRPHRLRSFVAATTAATLVLGAGAAFASSRALPGDPLYGLKREIEDVRLHLAGSDEARGRLLLDQATERLDEVEALAAAPDAHDPTTLGRTADTLAAMEQDSRVGAADLIAAYRENGHAGALTTLGTFAREQRQRLVLLVPTLDPSLRATARAIAAALAGYWMQTDRLTALSGPASWTGGGPVDAAVVPVGSGAMVDRLRATALDPGTSVSRSDGTGGSGGGVLKEGSVSLGTGSSGSTDGTGGTGGLLSVSGGNTSADPLPQVTVAGVPLPTTSSLPLPTSTTALPSAEVTLDPCVLLPTAPGC